MTEPELYELKKCFEAGLKILRRPDNDLLVQEIRLRADLEAVYSELLKQILRHHIDQDAAALKLAEERNGKLEAPKENPPKPPKRGRKSPQVLQFSSGAPDQLPDAG